MGWAAACERLTLHLALATGWPESEIRAMPLRRMIRYLQHLREIRKT